MFVWFNHWNFIYCLKTAQYHEWMQTWDVAVKHFNETAFWHALELPVSTSGILTGTSNTPGSSPLVEGGGEAQTYLHLEEGYLYNWKKQNQKVDHYWSGQDIEQQNLALGEPTSHHPSGTEGQKLIPALSISTWAKRYSTLCSSQHTIPRSILIMDLTVCAKWHRIILIYWTTSLARIAFMGNN